MPGITKLLLPSVGKSQVELYFTNRPVKRLMARYFANNGRTRGCRFGRFCIAVSARDTLIGGAEQPHVDRKLLLRAASEASTPQEVLLRVAEEGKGNPEC